MNSWIWISIYHFKRRQELEPSSYWNHGQKSLDTFTFVSLFVNSHLPNPYPPPPPTPAKPTSNVGRLHPEFFPEFQHCIFEKDALFY